jgi:hypothetical protein
MKIVLRPNLRNRTSWFSISTLVLSIVLFIIPSSSGEMGVGGEKFLWNGNESWSLILLGVSLIGFALRGLRKTGK